jgi:hypothetical protein
LSVALPEYFVFLLTLAALIVAHILDDSYSRDFKLVKHLNPLDDIDICEFLRCSHYHCRLNIHFLAECQLDVTCARGEIYNEIVQLAPVSVADQLIHEVGGDGASHDSGTVTFRCVLRYKAVAHSFHTTEFDGSYHCRVMFILEELGALRTDHGR